MKTNSGTVATASVGTLNVTRKWALTDDSETPYGATFVPLFVTLKLLVFGSPRIVSSRKSCTRLCQTLRLIITRQRISRERDRFFFLFSISFPSI